MTTKSRKVHFVVPVCLEWAAQGVGCDYFTTTKFEYTNNQYAHQLPDITRSENSLMLSS